MKWHFQHVPASTLSVLVAPTVQPDLVHVVSACEANPGPADISRQLSEQTLKRTGTLFSGFRIWNYRCALHNDRYNC